MGRPKREFSQAFEHELFLILQENHDELSKINFKARSLKNHYGEPPWNVTEILEKLRKKLSDKVSRKALRKYTLTDRGLRKRLEKHREEKILQKIRKGKEVYYYVDATSVLFVLKRIIRSFIDEMEVEKVEKGSFALGYTPIESTKTHLFTLFHNAVILEDGLDITSKLDWEDPPDIIGDIIYYLEKVITHRIQRMLRVKNVLTGTQSPQEEISALKKYFENKKLAVFYVLDGSRFEALEKEKMGKKES